METLSVGSYIFKSHYSPLAILQNFSTEEIKNEPMIFNGSYDFAYKNGGPITREFLNLLPPGWFNDSVFDSRVHMLMSGWYPCIPGYHHDDVPRTRDDGQPNYDDWNHSYHVMATVNSEIAPTYGLSGEISVPFVPSRQKVYSVWHKYLMEQIRNGILKEEPLPSNTLIDFDCNFFHRGSAAVKSGWRWFGRISKNTTRKPTNEIRRQTQVYLDGMNEGW